MIRLADPNYPAQVVYGHRLADTELIVSIGSGTLARALRPERSREWQAYVNDRDVEVVILEQHACPARARLREAELIAERQPILNRHHRQGPHRQVLRGFTKQGVRCACGAANCYGREAAERDEIGRDVDCARRLENGPEDVSGPIYVVGQDVYYLDCDGDGIGCE